MSHIKLEHITLIATLIILAITPSIVTALAFATACALYGLVTYLQRDAINQYAQLESKITALTDKLNNYILSKGLSR